MTDRRTFLCGLTAAGLTGFAAAEATQSGAAGSPAASVPFAFQKVRLGKTGIVTSRLGFGTGVCSNMRSSGIVRKNGFAGAVKIVRAAYDRGVRFFDTADSYGTHGVLAAALADVPRESWCLSTKLWFAPGGIPEADRAPVKQTVERFLRELKTDFLDVVELHCVTSAAWRTELAPQMEALDDLKREGKIRAHGCSFHSHGALAAGVGCAWLDCAHVRFNHRGRHMSTTPERQAAAIAKLRAQGTGVVGMKLLGQGSFDSADVDKSLAFVKASGMVDVYDVGFLSLAEVDDMVRRLG